MLKVLFLALMNNLVKRKLLTKHHLKHLAQVMFEKRKNFMTNMAEAGVGTGGTPIETGKHVYNNWDVILNKKGARHPKRDAFQLTDVEYTYTADMCPRTLDILGRTAYIPTVMKRHAEKTKELAAAIKKAAAKA